MKGQAKSFLSFLGDGMSLATVTAARILDGQRKGHPGEENQLAWETFPATALSKTYNTDAQTPDSAGTMTAIATGVKTHIGAIGVSAGRHNDCAQSLDHHLQSWLALAADAGMGTGLVHPARPTHPPPAAPLPPVPTRGRARQSPVSGNR